MFKSWIIILKYDLLYGWSSWSTESRIHFFVYYSMIKLHFYHFLEFFTESDVV